MNAVLATFLAMVSGTAHNLERPLPELTAVASVSSASGAPARYAYNEDHCSTTRSGVIVCPRRLR